MTETMLNVAGVSVAYGNRTVLDDVNLTVPAGSITAVLGPSGCGKTTLLRAIAGLEPITAGQISIAGEVVSDDRRQVAPEHRDVGLVPQDGALFPHLTVRRNIGFGIRSRAGRAGRVEEMVELVGLSDVADRRPAKLSGGQRQRVALARALAPAPSLIGLDEPFSALDAGLRTRLRTEVGRLLRQYGATALLVTHDPVEALALADQVVVLLDGKVRQAGTPEDVYVNPADARVGELFGDLNRVALDGQVHVVRPHEVRLAPVSASRAGQQAVGRVAAIEFRGSYHLVVVEPSGAEFEAETVISVVVPAAETVPSLGDETAVELAALPPL